MERSERSKITADKLASISSVVLLIALGLCGANFLVFRFGWLSGRDPKSGNAVAAQWPTALLMITGAIEILAIVGGVAGLLIAASWRILQLIRDRRERKEIMPEGRE